MKAFQPSSCGHEVCSGVCHPNSPHPHIHWLSDFLTRSGFLAVPLQSFVTLLAQNYGHPELTRLNSLQVCVTQSLIHGCPPFYLLHWITKSGNIKFFQIILPFAIHFLLEEQWRIRSFVRNILYLNQFTILTAVAIRQRTPKEVTFLHSVNSLSILFPFSLYNHKDSCNCYLASISKIKIPKCQIQNKFGNIFPF